MKSARYVVNVSRSETDEYGYVVSVSGPDGSSVIKGSMVACMEAIGPAIMADVEETL